jgi:endonuclease YncB( thermonuclease family)
MRVRPFLMPVVVLAASGGLVGWLLLADPPELPGGGETQPVALASGQAFDRSAPTEASPLSKTAQASSAAPLPGDIRDVSPEGVSAPRVEGNLKRVAPSKRYLELKDPPVEPNPDGPMELKRVQVLDGGHIRSGRLTIKLAYIKPLQDEETCLSRLGGSWPCGARARTFLRGLIRNFKVTCTKVEVTGPQLILATCTRGPFDLSKRMVRYGWADPAEDAPLEIVMLAEKAKDKKIGKWQSEWLSDLPATRWDGNPDAPLPGLEDLAPAIVEWSLKTEPDVPDEQGFEAIAPTPVR